MFVFFFALWPYGPPSPSISRNAVAAAAGEADLPWLQDPHVMSIAKILGTTCQVEVVIA